MPSSQTKVSGHGLVEQPPLIVRESMESKVYRIHQIFPVLEEAIPFTIILLGTPLSYLEGLDMMSLEDKVWVVAFQKWMNGFTRSLEWRLAIQFVGWSMDLAERKYSCKSAVCIRFKIYFEWLKSDRWKICTWICTGHGSKFALHFWRWRIGGDKHGG